MNEGSPRQFCFDDSNFAAELILRARERERMRGEKSTHRKKYRTLYKPQRNSVKNFKKEGGDKIITAHALLSEERGCARLAASSTFSGHRHTIMSRAMKPESSSAMQLAVGNVPHKE